MFLTLKKSKKAASFRLVVGFVLMAFVLSLPVNAGAQMLSLSPAYAPPLIKGITINPQNPLQFDFLIDVGNDDFRAKSEEERSAEYQKLIRYFLAALTVPEKDLWVNLSPYEKDRMIPEDFGKTEMGRDLLSQDYILKQITASMLHPEQDLGKEFWQEVYKQAEKKFGTIDIPVNTFNKVWIVPDRASVYEKDNTVLLIESHLKVMLEEDYLALQKSSVSDNKDVNAIGTQVVREIIIPAIEKEVNEGKNFAQLRQINSSLILATWYKTALKESLLGKIYVDRAKTDGVDQEDIADNQRIYEEYLEAFKKGAYNFIKEEVDPATQEIIPRKYFSGGYTTTIASTPLSERIRKLSDGPQVRAALSNSSIESVSTNLAEAASSPGLADPSKRNSLRTAGAGVAALILPHDPSEAAKFTLQDVTIPTVIEPGDTFEKIIKVSHFDRFLSQLDSVKKQEILRQALQTFKAENSGQDLKVEGVDEPIPAGMRLRFQDTKDYLDFAIRLEFSTLVAQQNVTVAGENRPIFYVIPDGEAELFSKDSVASAYGKQGIIININAMVGNLKNFKEAMQKKEKPPLLTEALSRMDALQYLRVSSDDTLGHELAHLVLLRDPTLRMRLSERWKSIVLNRIYAVIAEHEVWAYLVQTQRSQEPKIYLGTLVSLANQEKTAMSMKFHLGPVGLAGLIVVEELLTELGYFEYLAQQKIAATEAEEGHSISAAEAIALRRAVLGSWQESKQSDPQAETFLASKTSEQINQAAGTVFERLSGRKVPQIPPNLQPPQQVLDRALAMAASTPLSVTTDLAEASIELEQATAFLAGVGRDFAWLEQGISSQSKSGDITIAERPEELLLKVQDDLEELDRLQKAGARDLQWNSVSQKAAKAYEHGKRVYFKILALTLDAYHIHAITIANGYSGHLSLLLRGFNPAISLERLQALTQELLQAIADQELRPAVLSIAEQQLFAEQKVLAVAVGRELKRLREEKGLTLRAVAERMPSEFLVGLEAVRNLSVNFSDIENGHYGSLPLAKIAAWAAVLEKPIAILDELTPEIAEQSAKVDVLQTQTEVLYDLSWPLLGKAIRTSDISRHALEVKIGITPGTILHWLNRESRTNLQLYPAIAKVLDVPVESLWPAVGDLQIIKFGEAEGEKLLLASSAIDAWAQYSQISVDQLDRKTIESRFLELENILPLDRSARGQSDVRSVAVPAEPLIYLKEVVFYLDALDTRRAKLQDQINKKGKIIDADRRVYEKERDAVVQEYARGKKVFTMILSLALPWYQVNSWDVERVMGEKGAHLDLLIRGRNELISLQSMVKIVVAVERLKNVEQKPVVVSLLQRKLDLMHRENSQPIGQRIRAAIEGKGLTMSKALSVSDAQKLSQLSSGNGFTRNPEIFNRLLAPARMTWDQFLIENDDIKQKLTEEKYYEEELVQMTTKLAQRLIQLRGQRTRGDVVNGTVISPQLLNQYEQGKIKRINPRHLPVFAAQLEVSVSQIWLEEDLLIFNFPAAAKASSSLDETEESRNFTKGGIDLNPANMILQIKRDGKGVPLPLPQQDIQNIDINGFTPVIINITPVPSLPLLLGVNITGEGPVLSRNQ